jgi:hypothetical protein
MDDERKTELGFVVVDVVVPVPVAPVPDVEPVPVVVPPTPLDELPPVAVPPVPLDELPAVALKTEVERVPVAPVFGVVESGGLEGTELALCNVSITPLEHKEHTTLEGSETTLEGSKTAVVGVSTGVVVLTTGTGAVDCWTTTVGVVVLAMLIAVVGAMLIAVVGATVWAVVCLLARGMRMFASGHVAWSTLRDSTKSARFCQRCTHLCSPRASRQAQISTGAGSRRKDSSCTGREALGHRRRAPGCGCSGVISAFGGFGARG